VESTYPRLGLPVMRDAFTPRHSSDVRVEVQRADGTPWLEITFGNGARRRVLRADRLDEGSLELRESEEVVAVVRRCDHSRGPLTGREREVLALLARGQTNREVARSLGISIRTAELHRARIARKLGLSKRSELVEWALEHGLLGL
jgi:DNA-binding CsgD family transcriptional regulator